MAHAREAKLRSCAQDRRPRAAKQHRRASARRIVSKVRRPPRVVPRAHHSARGRHCGCRPIHGVEWRAATQAGAANRSSRWIIEEHEHVEESTRRRALPALMAQLRSALAKTTPRPPSRRPEATPGASVSAWRSFSRSTEVRSQGAEQSSWLTLPRRFAGRRR